jgi:hypothetical protein
LAYKEYAGNETKGMPCYYNNTVYYMHVLYGIIHCIIAKGILREIIKSNNNTMYYFEGKTF